MSKKESVYHKVFNLINEAFDELKKEVYQKIDDARLEFHRKVEELEKKQK